MKNKLLLTAFLLFRICLAGEVFPSATLQKYASHEPFQIFSDPKIACHLTVLMGKTHLDELIRNMNLLQYGEVDAVGSYPFTGFIRGLRRNSGGYVLIHPEGWLWVSYISYNDGEHLEYFTNDETAYKTPPEEIASWASVFDTKSWKHRSSNADKFSSRVKLECPKKKIAKLMKEYEARKQGKLCDSKREFYEPYVIDVKPGEKVYFKEGKSFLIAGDIVELATKEKKKEFNCVLYQADSKSKKVGELPRKNLKELDQKFFKNWAKSSSVKMSDWIGEWESKESNLQIQKYDEKQITVNGSSSAGVNTGQIEKQLFDLNASFAVTAKNQPENSVTCGIKLYKFNNALYLSELEQCGGNGVSFGGVYCKGISEAAEKARLNLAKDISLRRKKEKKEVLDMLKANKNNERQRK